LVPRWDEFECQGQKSKVNVSMDKKRVSAFPSPTAATKWSRLLHAARYSALYHYKLSNWLGRTSVKWPVFMSSWM